VSTYSAGTDTGQRRTVEQLLHDNGIELDTYAPGRHYTTCPRCSSGRSTAEHKRAKVLGVTIDHEGVRFGCNHCNWTGPEKGAGKGNGHDHDRGKTFHVYHDEDGVVLFRKVRNRPGVEPKCYWQRPDGKGGWVKGLKALTKRAKDTLYRLPEVKEAIASGHAIACVEGESDADALWDLGIPATCSPHGAAATRDKDGNLIQYKPKWYRAHSEQLRRADIIVFNDNDEPGDKHADTTCKCSLGIANSVRRLDIRTIWPDAPHNGDVKDWLTKADGTREQLDAFIAAAPLYGGSAGTPSAEAPSEPPPAREDFYAYLPQHSYIYMPTRELWPGSSVDTKIGEGAAEWLDQNRAVVQMIWAPGMPTVISNKVIDNGGWIDKPGDMVFNLYRPPTLPLGDKNKAAPWLDLVGKVYPHDVGHLVRYFAHRVQRPHEKINHGLVLGGPPGVGKDTLLEPVKRAIGPWNVAEVSPTQILGRFNSFVKSVILRVSEARDLGEQNRFALYEHMKTLLAAPPDVIRCDEKNIREHSVLNVCGVVITSNRKDSFYLPEDDRRHFVAWTELTKEDFADEYWKGIWRWYDHEGGCSHVAAYLTTLDLADFNPKAPPSKTTAFWEIVEANRAPENSELADAIDKLNNPDAVTVDMIKAEAHYQFVEWLNDRRNSRQFHHRMGECGYVLIRNTTRADGYWKFKDKRQAVYAKSELSIRDRHEAARALVEGRAPPFDNGDGK
jgi:hypothetical protein